MLLDTINDYQFISRSGGIIVLKGHIYMGFYQTMQEALNHTFGD